MTFAVERGDDHVTDSNEGKVPSAEVEHNYSEPRMLKRRGREHARNEISVGQIEVQRSAKGEMDSGRVR